MKKYMLDDKFCPVAKTLEVINTPWKILIVYKLINGTLRFNQIKREIPNISEKMLSVSLKELESQKIINRDEIHNGPLRVEYKLSQIGNDLIPIISAVTEFGNKNFKPIEKIA
ncbi:putative HTH-type transcriptional regulator YybR [Mesoplasma sp. JKS002658]|uniref:winged helix-turn-helix transcriptional regulator n=2 Tax=Mesoplasma whartonense TaxID=2878854 RepID=UPI002022A851|nr:MULTISPECIES: helix-turn-helix domain-containing protein [unclassified Mesoplasma]MCL8214953.1 putative HTH-type transcriptional regulator YybR [Mesoplasma sp. JKS002663]MCL8211644.1 putative HTH-type transcriptional regulator YybR [Mesoplasma sp. JKS002664]MCL8212383.1 putative HTH-type transcriptional regulator YybR [Mesoplasma sp. JKS002662]MCL8212777.1 putative HTH-type transcriptional regulator YybR [Mesoplasma sp. JKS002661]MCL8213530.1 putative HTH-type transcriptional regulator YybR